MQKLKQRLSGELEGDVRLAALFFALGISLMTIALLMDSGACPRWIIAWCSVEDATITRPLRPIYHPSRRPSDDL